MRDQFKPSIYKARSFGRPQDVECIAESCKGLEIDGLQHVLRCIELQQQHDENPMVGKLLKLALPDIMVLQENSHYYTENLDGTQRPRPISHTGEPSHRHFQALSP